MSNSNAVTLIKNARAAAVKNRELAVSKAAEPFNKEIESYDMALRHLGGSSSKLAPKAARKKGATKKAAPKKAAAAPAKKTASKKAARAKAAPPKKQATPVKAAGPEKKVAVAKKAAAKKAAPKKTAPKKAAAPKPAPSKPGGYPSDGQVLDKLAFIIKEGGKFMSIAQAAAVAKKHEPSEKIEILKKRFSKHMGKFLNSGRLVSYRAEAENKNYYGLAEYMSSGAVVKGHEHHAEPVK